MAHKNHIPLIGNFRFVIVSLLLSLAATGVTIAQNPVPLINQPLVPDTAQPGGEGFTLTVNGTGFVSGAVVDWDGHALKTTFVSSSQLTASVPASDIAKARTASVTVVNPSPGGGTSNVAFFPVTLPGPIAMRGSDYAVGSGPSSVGTADLRGIGKLDLVLVNSDDQTVSVLLGNGDGTFEPQVTYAVGDRPGYVAIADFNGDGKPDLAVTNVGSNTVSVLLGNGDGTFQPQVAYATGAGPWGVAAADVNGDGKLDLLVTNSGDTTISVLLGNGDGTFQSHSDYQAGATPTSVAIGDFNGDGSLDLAVADFASVDTVTILLGNGDGTFTTEGTYPVGSFPEFVAAADVNGDGKLDLVVADQASSQVSVLLGNGDGTFQPQVTYPVASVPTSILTADFNGEGKLDIAVPDYGDGSGTAVSILLGNGDGTFQPYVDFAVGQGPNQVAFGDFKRDGRLDLAAADQSSNQVTILLQIPAVSLSTTSLTFANQVLGTSSASQSVTLTNGGLPLTISSITVAGTDAGDFSETNTCGTGLPAGGSCTISVTFTPSQAGPLTASVAITDNAAGSPRLIALGGTGLVSGPNATLSPTSLTFATRLVGTTSSAQSVTLTNYGTAALAITGISVTGADPGDFAQANTCGGSLAPGASCTISVFFAPAEAGPAAATLVVNDNANGSPQEVSLSGTGTVVKLVPRSLSFHCKENYGCTTGPQSVTLTNVGTGTLSITSITIIGSSTFSQTNTCGSSVGAGGSCTITVTFLPTGLGEFMGYVSVADNGGGSPQQVSLLGWEIFCYHDCE